MKELKTKQLKIKAVDFWLKKWPVLTSGTIEHFNSMTIGWGSIGGIWWKPFVQVVVRPSRYTFEFMEKYSTFTVCSFPESYRDALQVLGNKSGRDGDKITETGLTVVASKVVEAPSYKEADLVLECRKMYWQDMEPAHFIDPTIEDSYPEKDYHRIYYGEILMINAEDADMELNSEC
ncbi:MAG: flavin reductase [Deltaproteobacteria bacterium]|nr:flavin reductase [Deltaproteobacteria bacterium]MBN2844537.1 flavin reductase [Deltaproteobacteria bacterium]